MKLFALNTIGYTGVEILAAEIARLPGVAFLPGQNFIQFGRRYYRPHVYENCSPEEIFHILNQHVFTKTGRCWSGLTKHMTEAEKSLYPWEKHKEFFVKSIGNEKSFFKCVNNYITSYFISIDSDISRHKQSGFWGQNIVLSDSQDSEINSLAVIDFQSEIYIWLAMASSHMTWNCIEACKFWIINTLFVDWFASKHSKFLRIRYGELQNNKENCLENIKKFLNLTDSIEGNIHNFGFIDFNPSLVSTFDKNAEDLRQIYSDNIYFRMATSIDEWSNAFISDSSNQALLQKYQQFWHSTAHTNLDWIDPIGNKIIEKAVSISAQKDQSNMSIEFYHSYSELNSDTHNTPIVKIEHYLGILEDDIVVPKLPYFLKIVIQYLENITKNYTKHNHSYLSVRESKLYKTIQQSVFQVRLDQLGIKHKLAEVESLIDEIDGFGENK